MPRPEIIRADSIDLQNSDAPSAQDHTRQPNHPGPLGEGPPAPHQADALREVAAEAAEEHAKSPRVSKEWSNNEMQHMQQYGDDEGADGRNGSSHQQDSLAVAQNGGHTGSAAEDADMADAEGDDGMDDDDDDDMMDKISSSPSIDDEDIDFEFVYALHTFVATVEGQANATKGDTMVLLDDSNSYWWLVRVVKDSSIGYLPAEHIETPTERLARLNKHRNIDLTSTMLGDQAEKSKNPLKKAIRRRNAKTVAFAPPTYFEASDNEYSSDEDDGDADPYSQQEQQAASQENNADDDDDDDDDDDIAAVEPLKPRAELRDAKPDSLASDGTRGENGSKLSSDTARSSDEYYEGKKESKSRNGTVRNTDSFFKDDTVETRKITLTPNLLRDDSSTSTRTSAESEKLKSRPSLEKLEKDIVSDKVKDKKEKKEKKEKEKKPGMLSGLFKRKEKRSKSQDEEIDASILARSSDEIRSSPVPSKDSEDFATQEEQGPTQSQAVQRQPSKLQKAPKADTSPTIRQSPGNEQKATEAQQAPASERAPAADIVEAPTMRIVQPEGQPKPSEPLEQIREVSPELSRGNTPVASPPREQKSTGAISKILRSASSSNSEAKPVKAKKAKARVELDDFDSSGDNSPVEEIKPKQQPQRPIPGAFPDSYIATPAVEKSNAIDDRLSESPVQVSPINLNSHPPALMVDTSSQEDAPSPVSSLSPSPELIDPDDARDKKGPGSSSTSTPTWSDSHLRTFFDDDADIKDLLVVVYDKSGVVPAGPDHPITGNLFREENAKLADITNRLDGMLGDWLARKTRSRASR